MNLVSEKPILFQADMIEGIQDFRKTRTRRTAGLKEINKNPDEWIFKGWEIGTGAGYAAFERDGVVKNVGCPYGFPGHQLWVRETWAPVNHNGLEAIAYRADHYLYDLPKDIYFNFLDPVPENWLFDICANDLLTGSEKGWRPSIYMPRWVSRLQLGITDIKVQRLQNITEEDAMAEGIISGEVIDRDFSREAGTESKSVMFLDYDVISLFHDLWDSINKKKGLGWDINPYVWVVEFDLLEVKR